MFESKCFSIDKILSLKTPDSSTLTITELHRDITVNLGSRQSTVWPDHISIFDDGKYFTTPSLPSTHGASQLSSGRKTEKKLKDLKICPAGCCCWCWTLQDGHAI